MYAKQGKMEDIDLKKGHPDHVTSSTKNQSPFLSLQSEYLMQVERSFSMYVQQVKKN
jgi:hypothetical protein